MRGTVVGLVVATGATWGHQWAGGGAAADPGLLLLLTLASVAGGHLVARRGRVALPVLLALAAGAQVGWHLLLPGPAHGDHGSGGPAMLAAHLVVVAATVVLATGADRAVVGLARDALARPPLPLAVPRLLARSVAWRPLPLPQGREVAPYGARGPPRADPSVRARTSPVWSTRCPCPVPSPPVSPVC